MKVITHISYEEVWSVWLIPLRVRRTHRHGRTNPHLALSVFCGRICMEIRIEILRKSHDVV